MGIIETNKDRLTESKDGKAAVRREGFFDVSRQHVFIRIVNNGGGWSVSGLDFIQRRI